MDIALYWLGAAVALIGGAGLVSLLLAWAADEVLKATGLARIIVQWYAAKLTKERDARRKSA